MKKATLTENKAEQTPTGGVLVGKRQGQTIIHNKGTLSGYLVGKTHAEGGIKAVNKSTGQPLEMQGGEVVITAPAVSDNTKNEFNGKMMTNREILSQINVNGGGVAFAKDGMEIPKSVKRTGASYKYGGKTMTDHEIYKHITGKHLADGMTLSQIAKKHKVSLKELQKQVDLGMKAESEHTSSKREQMKIVKDHLFENPKYYTLLKRAGLNYGGRVRRDSLVRDSKRGNTPARDLNNYNDVLDMDADGVVGAETGLFDDGGSVKEVVDYVSFAKYSDVPFHEFDESNYVSFSEFKNVVKELYEDSGYTNKRTIGLCINNMDSVSRFEIQVSKGRNTNSNFNPYTGTFKDLEKNLQKFSAGNFDMFDWDKWGGVKTTKATPSQTSKPIDLLDKKIWVANNPELSKRVQELGFANGFVSINGKSVGGTNYANIYFNRRADGSKYMYILDYDKDAFDKEQEIEIFESDLFPNATASVKKSLVTGENLPLIPDMNLNFSGLIKDLPDPIKRLALTRQIDAGWLADEELPLNESFADGMFKWSDTPEKTNFWDSIFQGNFEPFKKIYGNYGEGFTGGFNVASTPTSVPFDLKQKKIWIGNNPALSKKIQERAFQLGFDWWGGNGNAKNLNFDNLFFDLNEKITSGSDRANFDSFNDFEEITEQDLFPTATASTSASTPTSATTTTSGIYNASEIKLFQEIDKIIKGNNLEPLENPIVQWSDSISAKDFVLLNDETGEVFNLRSYNVTLGVQREDTNKDRAKGLLKIYINWKATQTTGGATASTSTSTPTSVPINLNNTKIWIGDNPALSERIQEKAFELGWSWGGGGNTITKYKDTDSLFFSDSQIIAYSSNGKDWFNNEKEREIFESDLFPTSNSSQTSNLESEMKNFDFSTLFEKENEDWVKKFTADLDKLVVPQNDPAFTSALSKEHTDLDALIKLLPSFQQSKYAVERAKILNEIKKLHYKLTYEGFIKPNEALSSDANLFTPQGLLDYYFTQATQNPTADLEPACELITPNGEKSKLPLSAYLNVRTPQFKNWFGDWEKAYETGNYVNCSKMIDPDTKEPKIYFHGVRKYVPNFGQFSNMGQGVKRPYGSFEPPNFNASFFAGEEEYAKFYGGVAENMRTPSSDYKPFIYKVFLSVKNPISLLPLDFMLSYKDFIDYVYVGYGVKVDPNQELLKQLNNDMTTKNPMWIYVRKDIGFIEKLKDYGYDALFQMGDIPTFLPDGTVEPDRTKHLQEVEYLTFYPSQVKSATVKKSFYFDFFNDIRFKNGGYVRI